MTDNEIVKALNTAADKDFVKVYLWDDKPPKVTAISVADIADLINRQKAEIERLQAYHDDMESAIYQFREDHAKVKFFKGEIKAEAVKEFAERLCEDRVSNDPVVIAVRCELKEMVGDDQ